MIDQGTRKQVDLRALPAAVQYGLALITVAIVVAAAALFGNTEMIPHWVSEQLIPALAWIFLGALALAGLMRAWRALHDRRSRRS